MKTEKNPKIPYQVLDTAEQVYFEIAMDMFETILEKKRQNQKTVMIVPVGPVNHYSILAWLLNRSRVSLNDVYFLNMDEYLDDQDHYIDIHDPLSFRGFMEEGFHALVDPELAMPKENRIFPQPGNEGEIGRKIAELGGVDACYGGMGITGHIAFNEPPLEPMDADEYAELGTRTLDVSPFTRAINAVGSAQGNYHAIPSRCITIGMKEILSARKIRIMMTRTWQTSVFDRAVYGPVTAQTPSTLLQRHPDAKLIVTPWVPGTESSRLI